MAFLGQVSRQRKRGVLMLCSMYNLILISQVEKSLARGDWNHIYIWIRVQINLILHILMLRVDNNTS